MTLTLPGLSYLKAQQSSVDAILSPKGIKRQVVAQGDMFLNQDRWTAKAFQSFFLTWIRKNPGKAPSQREIQSLVDQTNKVSSPTPKIIVAQVPDPLSHHLVLALMGGAYHEAWHTVYSKRSRVRVEQVQALCQKAGQANLKRHLDLISDFCDIIEDIRIERRGNEDYAGASPAMAHLQDFILDMEGPPSDEKSTLLRIFRDLGLGYDTEKSKKYLDTYRRAFPSVCDLVEKTLLQPQLKEAMSLSRKDDFGFLRVALDCVVELANCGKAYQEQRQQGPGQGQNQGQGQGGQGGRGKARGSQSFQGGSDPQTGKGRGRQGGKPGRGRKGRSETPSGGLLGGGHFDAGKHPERTLRLASTILNQDSKIEANTSLLAEAIKQEIARLERDVKHNEAIWLPYSTGKDALTIVTSRDRQRDAEVARTRLFNPVMSQINFFRARLRNLVLAQQMTDVSHGHRKGRRLSNRMLVDTKVDLLNREIPRRPYQLVDEKAEVSLEVAVCIDESGSTSNIQKELAQAAMVLIEPIEAIGGKSTVFGFRDGPWMRAQRRSGMNHHRYDAIRIDVFKQRNEKFRPFMWRFANTVSSGSTPMSDGIQFGLNVLSDSKAKHRLLVVLTDGAPNHGHHQVVNYQIRKAQEANVHMLGVGIGKSAKLVKKLFKDYVYVDSISDLPMGLIAKISEICGFGGLKPKRVEMARMRFSK